MPINDEKTYGELMCFLLQRRRHHGTEDRFNAYIVEAVQVLAKDLRDIGVHISVDKVQTIPEAIRRDYNTLSVGCE
ncbi:MAG TPA: hypothetical protein VKN18_14165 [Blastocatellia bacterium]|nr:hypothetical protein [Blastocatellia bacterium]